MRGLGDQIFYEEELFFLLLIYVTRSKDEMYNDFLAPNIGRICHRSALSLTTSHFSMVLWGKWLNESELIGLKILPNCPCNYSKTM